jgi:hypothetical protein
MMSEVHTVRMVEEFQYCVLRNLKLSFGLYTYKEPSLFLGVADLPSTDARRLCTYHCAFLPLFDVPLTWTSQKYAVCISSPDL